MQFAGWHRCKDADWLTRYDVYDMLCDVDTTAFQHRDKHWSLSIFCLCFFYVKIRKRRELCRSLKTMCTIFRKTINL